MTRSTNSWVVAPDDAHVEAIQAWQGEDGKCRVLYHFSDQDMTVNEAAIYEIDSEHLPSFELLHAFNEFPLSLYVASPEDYFVLDAAGAVHECHNSAWTSNKFADSMMLRVWGLGRRNVFLFGTEGNAYRYDGARWTHFDMPTEQRLNDMHGLSADRIYAVGDLGAMARFDGSRWHTVDAGVENELRAVSVGSDGAIYVGGAEGTCFRLQGEERYDFDVPDSMFQAICEFQGKRYWGDDETGVFRQERTRLRLSKDIDFAYYMTASRKKMAVTSGPQVAFFDGKEWTAVELRHSSDGWGFVTVEI
ncbi:hypothetical protein EV128_10631 [Rhizobium azibense]|nr:hypothetical protein EV128_10631 [Rhizobium azibense]